MRAEGYEIKARKNLSFRATGQGGKGAGYERPANFVRWAKLFNLKEVANTLNFLTEHGISDYDELVTQSKEAGKKFDAASVRIKQVESRLAELSELRNHIINYSKTHNIYTAYHNAKDKEAYLAAHRDGIALHESAKKAFDKLGEKRIPKVAETQSEFSSLLAEKTSLHQKYRKARKV